LRHILPSSLFVSRQRTVIHLTGAFLATNNKGRKEYTAKYKETMRHAKVNINRNKNRKENEKISYCPWVSTSRAREGRDEERRHKSIGRRSIHSFQLVLIYFISASDAVLCGLEDDVGHPTKKRRVWRSGHFTCQISPAS
jgi:hypothetical protein